MATNWVTTDILGINPEAMVVLSGSTIANTILCSADTTLGEVKPWDGTNADTLMGWHFGDSVTGAGSALGTGAQVFAKIVRGGFTVKNLTVVGVNTTTPSDTWNDIVYAIDSDSYTLAATSNVIVGRIVASQSSSTSTANVYFNNVYGNVT